MDSLTQLVLGAACLGAMMPSRAPDNGEAATAHRVRLRRALIYGAALGTLPDLDALIPFSDPLDSLILHRSASHSLLVLPWLGLLLFYLCQRFDPVLRQHSGRWIIGFQLALLTHPLLDFFTNYGTQLLWPLSNYPFATGSVFIIDPVVTLPLLLACGYHWFASPSGKEGSRSGTLLTCSLAWACGYLGFGLATQHHAETRIARELRTQQKYEKPVLAQSVVAAPLSSLMHRAVLRRNGEYWEAYLSVFDGDAPLRWARFYSDDQACAAIENTDNFQRLKQFSKGLYRCTLQPPLPELQPASEFTVSLAPPILAVADLRMGSEPHYVFEFDFGTPQVPHTIVKQHPMRRADVFTSLSWLGNRLFDPTDAVPMPYTALATPLP